MSTKIYDGFRIDNLNIFEIHDKINKFKTKASEYAKSQYNKKIVKDAITTFDFKTIDNKEVSFTDELINLFMEATDKHKDSNYTSLYDYGFSIVLYPINNFFLGTVHTLENHLLKMWLNQKYIKRFPYWDNTDKPDNISYKQWDERRDLWNLVLPGAGVPIESGFYRQIIDSKPGFPPGLDVIKKDNLIPSFKDRVCTQAEDKAYMEWCNRHNKPNVIRSYLEFRDSINTKETKEIIKNISKTIKPILIKDIIKKEIKKGK